MSEAPLSSDDLFYVINLSHMKRTELFVTFWRPANRGYAYPLSWAGKYRRDQIMQSYHNSGENIAVMCSAVDPLAEPTPKGWVDGDAGPIIYSTRKNWNVLLAAVIAAPDRKPKPLLPRTRRAA